VISIEEANHFKALRKVYEALGIATEDVKTKIEQVEEMGQNAVRQFTDAVLHSLAREETPSLTFLAARASSGLNSTAAVLYSHR